MPRTHKTALLRWVAVVLWMCGGALPGVGVSELEIKAAMLYNFLKFVEWPEAAGWSRKAPFVIGVHGSGNFADVLARTVGERTVQGRPVLVRQLQDLSEARACQVMYVSGAHPGKTIAVIEAARHAAILTVGDAAGFARQGGMIGFVMVDSRTNFEINVEASQRAGLKVSSKLLRLATVVKEGE
jgi:hypothetical protein